MRSSAISAWVILAFSLAACGTFDDDSDKPDQPDQPAAQVIPDVPPAEQVIVTDANGLTIYYYDRDKPNRSTCNNRCTEFWFPVRPAPQFAGVANFSSIKRLDGTQQLTFRKRPLYTFHRDKKPGDTKGDGQQGVWHVLKY